MCDPVAMQDRAFDLWLENPAHQDWWRVCVKETSVLPAVQKGVCTHRSVVEVVAEEEVDLFVLGTYEQVENRCVVKIEILPNFPK